MKKYVFLVLSLLFLNRGYAQKELLISHKGYPYLTHFTPQDYLGGSQNWDIAQDERGFIYICNGGSAILRYDGENWRQIFTDAGVLPRDIEINDKQQIFIGSHSDIGMLTPDSVGFLQYTSLKHLVADSLSIPNILDVHISKGLVFFMARNLTFIYNPIIQKIQVLRTPYYWASTVTSDELYVAFQDKGLVKYANGKFDTVAGGGQLAKFEVSTLLEHQKHGLIITDNKRGVFVFQEQTLHSLDVLSPEFLTDKLLYKALKLSDAYYAFQFFQGGIIIFDADWRVVQYLDKTSGLDERVHGMFLDKSNDLWITTNTDIVHAEINSPITVIDERLGGTESIYDIKFVDGKLYTAGSKGIFKKQWKAYENPLERENYIFEKIDAARDVWKLMVKDDYILAPATSSFLVMKEDQLLKTISSRSRSGTFINDKDHVVFAAKDGKEIVTLRFENDRWNIIAKITENLAPGNMFFKMENSTEPNVAWGYNRQGVFKLQFNTSLNAIINVKHYGIDKGFPSNYGNRFTRVNDEFYFVTYNGLYEYLPQQDTIVKVDRFNGHLSAGGLFVFDKDPLNNYWFRPVRGGFLDGILRPQNETFPIKYERDTTSTAQIYEGISAYNGNDSSYMLIGTNFAGLYLYNQKSKTDADFYVMPQIIQANVTTDKDSIVFAGNWFNEEGGISSKQPKPLQIDYANNSIRLNFAVPYFKSNDDLFFSYKLEGFEQKWSKWTRKTEKEYTNLPVGRYTFKLKARNIFNIISEEAGYDIRIVPPWYLTIWAYGSYMLIFLGFIWTVVKVNSLRLKKENEKLENTISERTEKIRQQAEKLKTLDNAKSRFFANVSHELRTPLTLIQGPLESVLSGKAGKIAPKVQDQLTLSRKSTKKLLRLVEEILDLSKLEAGKLELKPEAVKCYDLVNRIFYTYQSSYSGKHLDFQMQYDLPEETILKLDIGKFEKVLDNLMSNAVKFTRDQGRVKMTVKHTLEQLEISVEDTGVGIAPDELAQVFNRFYQSGSGKKYKGGTGIGLALAKELVELMSGTLKVKSVEHEGTVFTLTIPYEEATAADIPLKITALPEGAEIIENLSEATEIDQDPLLLRNVKILVVEDDPSMRKYIASQLEAYAVDQAADGLVAIELIEKNNYDLVITDLMMPRLDGMDLVSHLRQKDETKNTSIMMLTARAADEDIVNALTIGVNDYMVKPFNPDELTARVRNILSNRASRTEAIELDEQVSFSDQFLNDLKALVLDHLKSSNFNVASMADKAALSERQLNRRIKQATGLTAAAFIREIRLNEARLLLEKKTYSTISEVSYATGFETPGYFTTVYTKRFGRKPGDYLSS